MYKIKSFLVLLLYCISFSMCNSISNNKIIIYEYGTFHTIDSDYTFEEFNSNEGTVAMFYYITDKKLDSLFRISKENNGDYYVTKNYYVNNRIIKTLETYNGNLKEETNYEYDKNGNQTKFDLKEYNKDGSIVKSYFENTEYESDKNTNWIKRKSIDSDNNTFEQSRKIVYKGEDMSEYNKKYLNYTSFYNLTPKKSDDINSNLDRSSQKVVTVDNTNSENYIQQTQQRKCYKCGGSGKCSNCIKTFTVHYWNGSSWKDENQTRPGQVICTTCYGAGVLRENVQNTQFKKCPVSRCNNGWITCDLCNYGGNGRKLGLCSECDGKGYKN